MVYTILDIFLCEKKKQIFYKKNHRIVINCEKKTHREAAPTESNRIRFFFFKCDCENIRKISSSLFLYSAIKTTKCLFSFYIFTIFIQQSNGFPFHEKKRTNCQSKEEVKRREEKTVKEAKSNKKNAGVYLTSNKILNVIKMQYKTITARIW